METSNVKYWSKMERFNLFRCGVHSEPLGYTIEQDLSKDYPMCCAKLVRAERKFKRVDAPDSSAVKISKFKGRILSKKYDSTTSKEEVSSTTLAPVKSTKLMEKEDEVIDSEEVTDQPIDLNEE